MYFKSFSKFLILSAVPFITYTAGTYAYTPPSDQGMLVTYREEEGRYQGGGEKNFNSSTHSSEYHPSGEYHPNANSTDNFHRYDANGNGNSGNSGNTYIFSGQTDQQYENQLYNQSQSHN
jgi:hypothetical protein